MSKVAKVLSILSLNEVAAHEKPVRLEMKMNGDPTGIVFLVVGAHAESVKRVTSKNAQKYFNANRLEARGKPSGLKVDDYEKAALERAAAAVVGWEGPEETFDKETLHLVLSRNPSFVNQIIETIENEELFTNT